MMKEWFYKNGLQLLIILVGLAVAWGGINTRLNIVEAQELSNANEIKQYSILVERVIKLEENRQVVSGDIKEIKDGIKELNSKFQQHLLQGDK